MNEARCDSHAGVTVSRAEHVSSEFALIRLRPGLQLCTEMTFITVLLGLKPAEKTKLQPCCVGVCVNVVKPARVYIC